MYNGGDILISRHTSGYNVQYVCTDYLDVTWSMRCCLNMYDHLLTMLSRPCLNGLESILNHKLNTVVPYTQYITCTVIYNNKQQ